MQQLRSIIPELILLNRLVTPDTDSIELQLTSHRQDVDRGCCLNESIIYSAAKETIDGGKLLWRSHDLQMSN